MPEHLGAPIAVRLYRKDLAYLRDLAAKTKIKRGWYVRAAVEDWINRRKTPKRRREDEG